MGESEPALSRQEEDAEGSEDPTRACHLPGAPAGSPDPRALEGGPVSLPDVTEPAGGQQLGTCVTPTWHASAQTQDGGEGGAG